MLRVIFAAAAFGCTAAAAPVLAGVTPPPLRPGAPAPPHVAMAPFAGRAGAGILYASNFYPSQIEVYDAEQKGLPLIGTINNGVSSPYHLTSDAAGTLYVENNNSTVSEFHPRQLTPFKILYEATNMGTGVGLTVGPDGTVYVTDHFDGLLFEFAGGSTTPTTTISIDSPLGVAVSKKNDVYVSYGNSQIAEFKGGKLPAHVLPVALQLVGDLEFAPDGDLLAGDQGTMAIDVIKIAPKYPVVRKISTMPAYPYDFTLDAQGKDLYLASGQPNGVFVFDYKTGKPEGGTTQGFSQQDYTEGVALGPVRP